MQDWRKACVSAGNMASGSSVKLIKPVERPAGLSVPNCQAANLVTAPSLGIDLHFCNRGCCHCAGKAAMFSRLAILLQTHLLQICMASTWLFSQPAQCVHVYRQWTNQRKGRCAMTDAGLSMKSIPTQSYALLGSQSL